MIEVDLFSFTVDNKNQTIVYYTEYTKRKNEKKKKK